MERFFTEYLVINEDNKIQCRKCGSLFGDIDENYKKFALSAEIIPSKIGPLRPDDGKMCLYREFYCPGCATLIDVDIIVPGDPISHDIRLKK